MGAVTLTCTMGGNHSSRIDRIYGNLEGDDEAAFRVLTGVTAPPVAGASNSRTTRASGRRSFPELGIVPRGLGLTRRSAQTRTSPGSWISSAWGRSYIQGFDEVPEPRLACWPALAALSDSILAA